MNESIKEKNYRFDEVKIEGTMYWKVKMANV